jgi:hypothetical protein
MSVENEGLVAGFLAASPRRNFRLGALVGLRLSLRPS